MGAILLVEDRETLHHWLAKRGAEALVTPRYHARWFREDVLNFDEFLHDSMADGDPIFTTEELLDEPRMRVVATWTEEEGVRPCGDPLDPETMVAASARYLGPDSYRHLTPEQFRLLLISTVHLGFMDEMTSRCLATALLEASPEQLSGISTTVLAKLLASQDAPLRTAAMRRAPLIMTANQKYRARLPR